jgi:hypothetical protein
MCNIDWPGFFDVLKDIVLAGAAAVTAWVAVKGLQKWREELRGRADFDVARGLARATYKVRDDLAACRMPLIRTSEFPDGYSSIANDDHAARVSALAHVYNNRWKPVTDALREFDA